MFFAPNDDPFLATIKPTDETSTFLQTLPLSFIFKKKRQKSKKKLLTQNKNIYYNS